MKPPSTSMLPGRHRRLCSTCQKAPVSSHTDQSAESVAFTSAAYARDPCVCPDIVFLCQSCGHGLANADTTYRRIWIWRTRYSTGLGGLGTGIGEGNEGVECGRRDRCLAATDIEVEIVCENAESSPDSMSESDSDEWVDGVKVGYWRQEIEGIGGVVKKKSKKKVRVGKTTKEYEDERERAKYMAREMRGENRSWCAWCSRVILGVQDI